jgi:two-component system, NarL family, sensor kinase
MPLWVLCLFIPLQIPTNHIILLVVLITLIFLVAAGFLLLYVAMYNQKKKKHKEEKIALQSVFENELLKTRLEIQEETFRNISQEIHDNIGQSLSLVKLTIATARPEDKEQVTGALASSKQLLTKAIQDLRNLSHSLSPDFLDTIGLPAALEQQLQQLEKTKQYTTTFTTTGHPEKLNLQKEMVLLRIVQELLNNTIKHARATAVSIDMKYQNTGLTITVKDNGIGFTPAPGTSPAAAGIGLTNIHNRMKMIESTISIQSAPGKGTAAILSISLPVI